jgi:hypothetical protein
MIDGLQHEIHLISLNAKHFFLWAPKFHPVIIIYLHLKFNQRPSIPLPMFDAYVPLLQMCIFPYHRYL